MHYARMSRLIDYKEPNFIILLWQGEKPTPVAAAENIAVILAAWPVAVEAYARGFITLQQGARVIRSHNCSVTRAPSQAD